MSVMNKIYAVAGTLIALGTIGTALGYSFPWTSADAGTKLDRREQQHYQTLEQQIQQTNAGVADLSRVVKSVDLNTQEAILLSSKAQIDAAIMHERRGTPSWKVLYEQKLRTDGQLRRMGVLP